MRQGQDDSHQSDCKLLRNEGHITIHESKEEDQGSVTRGDVKVVKEIIMKQAIVKDS